jgi:hypothetical protein
MQCWRVAKIHAATVVDLMEDLRLHGAKYEDLVACDKALKVWNAERSSLWKLPGHSYDDDDMSEEARMSVKLMLEVLELTVKKLSRDLDEEDRRAGQELSTAPTCVSQSHTAAGEEDDPPTSAISPPTPVRSPAPLPPETGTPAQSSPECHSPSPTPSLVSSSSSSSSKAGTPTLSILKRKSSTPGPCASAPSATPRPTKRVRYTTFASVSPECLATTNPSPFISASPAQLETTVQPHRVDFRSRSTFRRTSPQYVPGKWASPAFTEKANTSHYKTSWPDCEKLTRTEVEEGEKESRVATGLKNLSGAWVMRWWLGNVATRVDLERMKATAVGKVGSEKVA